jgi:hypothetical protein
LRGIVRPCARRSEGARRVAEAEHDDGLGREGNCGHVTALLPLILLSLLHALSRSLPAVVDMDLLHIQDILGPPPPIVAPKKTTQGDEDDDIASSGSDDTLSSLASDSDDSDSDEGSANEVEKLVLVGDRCVLPPLLPTLSRKTPFPVNHPQEQRCLMIPQIRTLLRTLILSPIPVLLLS